MTYGMQTLLAFLALVVVPPFWRIFVRAGYSGWWSLVMLVPFANLVLLWVFAFVLKWTPRVVDSRPGDL